MRATSLGLLAGLLLLALLVLITPAAPAPAIAQPPAPTASPATTTTTVPATTPVPTPADAVEGLVSQAEHLWSRYGWWTIGIVALLVLLWGLNYFFGGIGEALKELGKRAGNRILAALDWITPRSSITNYLKWLPKAYGTIKPIGIANEKVKLDVTRVHVPLRLLNQAEAAQDQRQIFGKPGGDEFRPVRAGYRRIGAPRVFTLLGEEKLLARSGKTRFRRVLDAVVGKFSGQNRTPLRYSSDDAFEQVPLRVTTRLLLLGDAGSGKTMTLRYAALRLADAYGKRKSKLLSDENLGLYLSKPPLPIYVRLTEFARSLKGQNTPPTPDQFLTWLDEKVKRDLKPGSAPVLSRYVADGRALLLLDGLDEAGSEQRRADLAEMIGALAETYDQNRYVVASRPAGYGGSVHLERFAQVQLDGLNEQEARALLLNWFTTVDKLSAKDEANKLWGSIALNRRLLAMAVNPLLLTAMAALHLNETELPNERAKLYEKLVELLLGLWRKQQLGAEDKQEEWSIDQLSDERRNIEDLALWMQMRTDQATELTLAQAQDVLCPRYMPGRHPDAARAHVYDLLEVLTLQSGLLRRSGDQMYVFSHYTFQEYLTACALDDLDKSDRYRSVDFLLNRSGDQRWRETLLLAVGRWSSGERRDIDKAERLVRELLDRRTLDALLLAAEALADIRAEKKLPLLRDRAICELKLVAFDPARCSDPPTRNRAATLLDRLDADERPRLGLEDAAYWSAPIPPGPFVMGDDNGKYDAEKPAFTYTIRRPYALARYPVTNRQYLRFLESLESSGRAEEAERRRPRYWPGRRYRAGEGNHPVVAVNWEDATAFAAWVDQLVREQGVLKEGEQVRLPTEPEWERAAAYPVALSASDNGASRREYPWGDWPAEAAQAAPLSPDEQPAPSTPLSRPGRGVGGEGGEGHLTATTNGGINAGIPANISESGISSTSVVGIFPHGAAARGAEDMAGNVWEWCSTLYIPYQEIERQGGVEPETLYSLSKKGGGRTYVLRGGSWLDAQSIARCARRYGVNADAFDDDLGLRLAHLFSFT